MFCSPVLQEAVSTGDPEMVQLVLQYRDYQRATRRLAGIPELLSKLRRVWLCPGAWGVGEWAATLTPSTGVPLGHRKPLDIPCPPRIPISS